MGGVLQTFPLFLCFHLYKYFHKKITKMDIKEFLEIQEAYSRIYSPIDELYKGKHGQSDAEYQAGRSDAGKRISGDEKTGPRYYTLGRARGAAVDSPTAPGARPVNTPKLSASEKEYHQYNKSGAKRRAEYNKVGGRKGLPEDVDLYDIILSYLLDEGYADTQEMAESIMVNMSDEWREQILDEAKVDEPLDPVQKLRARNKRLQQDSPQIPLGSQTTARRSRHETSRGKKKVPGRKTSYDNQGNMIRSRYRQQQFKRTGNDLYKEEVDIYDIILSHLLDEGYVDTQEAAETIMVTMSDEWREEILDEAKDETEIGISGLPVPKRKMSPKKRYEFEKKRRENIGTNVGGTKYSSGMAQNGKSSR